MIETIIDDTGCEALKRGSEFKLELEKRRRSLDGSGRKEEVDD